MEIRHMAICDEQNGGFFGGIVGDFCQNVGREIGEVAPTAIIKRMEVSPIALPDHLAGFREVVSLCDGGTTFRASKIIDFALVASGQRSPVVAALRDTLIAALRELRSRKVTAEERQRLIAAIERAT